MANFNLKRVTLSDNYNKALSGFGNTQELFQFTMKYISSQGDNGQIKDVLSDLQEASKKISTVLSSASNKEIVNGLLFKLNSDISKKWLGSSKLTLLVPGVIDKTFYETFQKRLKNNTENIYLTLEEASKARNMLHDVIRGADWKGLAGGALSGIANMTPYGSILNRVGGFVYNAWDKKNKASWNDKYPVLQGNIAGNYGKKTWEDFNPGGFNKQGTGGTVNGGGGWAGGVQSGVNFDPKSNRFRGANGQFLSNATGVAGLNNDPLFVFFNKNAYFAGWTKDVLGLLKTIAGVESGSNSLWGNIKKGLEEGLGIGAAVSGEGLLAGGIGGLLGRIFGFGKGAKAVGGGLGNIPKGSTNIQTQSATKSNFLKSALGNDLLSTGVGTAGIGAAALFTGSLIKAWSDEASSFDKLSDANDNAAFQQFLKVNNMNRKKKGLPPVGEHIPSSTTSQQKAVDSKDSTLMLMAVLSEILKETKKQVNDKKDDKGKSSSSNTTQRVIHNDIGDTTTQLLNVGVLGNPRK